MLTKRFTRRESILLGVLALLILAAGYFLLIHRPVTESLATLAVAQEEADTRNLVLELKAARLTQMEEELSTIRANPAVAEIPDYDNLRRVMVFLNTTLASAVDYDLNFRQVTMPEEGRMVRRVIDMSFRCGSYDAARTVVTALYASPYRCQLGDVSMAPADQNSGLNRGSVAVELTITLFERVQ